MFAGIVETTARVLSAQYNGPLLNLTVERPGMFDDLSSGDSICTDGVCLTLEDFNANRMQFALGPETLRVTEWTPTGVMGRVVNLERSLRLNDRVHGHLVIGHVDTTGNIVEVIRNGDTQMMEILIPSSLKPYIWPKGSIAINGVSLTVNLCSPVDHKFTVGLIPETLRRTNLGQLKPGDRVNLEVDNLARGLVHWASENVQAQKPEKQEKQGSK
jgi:riboflavin synthase